MYRRQTASAAAVVRLPPLPRRPQTNVSNVDDHGDGPWGLDNPALRQLSTHAGSRTLRNRSRATRRSFRSSKVTLPDINGRKARLSGSARSMRSTYSTISSATVKSTRSLDMFRYNMSSRTPQSVVSASLLQIPTHYRHTRKSAPGSALSISSVSTIPLPPIEVTVHRAMSRDDLTSTVIPDDDDEDDYEDDVISVWPGEKYGYQPSVDDVMEHEDVMKDHDVTRNVAIDPDPMSCYDVIGDQPTGPAMSNNQNINSTELTYHDLRQSQGQGIHYNRDNGSQRDYVTHVRNSRDFQSNNQNGFSREHGNDKNTNRPTYESNGIIIDGDFHGGNSPEGPPKLNAPPKPTLPPKPSLPPKPQLPPKPDLPPKPQLTRKPQVPPKLQMNLNHEVPPKQGIPTKMEVPPKPGVPPKQDYPLELETHPDSGVPLKPETQPELPPEIPPEIPPETQPEMQPEIQPEIQPEVPPEVGITAPPGGPRGREDSGIVVRGEDAPSVDEPEHDEVTGVLDELEEERRFRSLPTTAQVGRVFSGDFRFLPPMPRTTVRVFFWASPTGFHEERGWIHTKCHGELQRYCADRGLDFHLVDLHLVGYDLVDHETSDELCRDQLEACQRLSLGPVVLALVSGDDLPRSLPSSMSPGDFSVIAEIADRKDLPHRDLLKAHYQPLVSSNGTEVIGYQLQPGMSDPAESCEGSDLLSTWDMTAVRLRELLRKTLVSAVVERKVSKDQAKAYLESEPGDQVHQTVSSYPDHSLCYIRQHLDHFPVSESRQGSSTSLFTSLSAKDRSSAARSLISGRLSVDITKKLDFLECSVPTMRSRGRVYNLQPLKEEEAEPANLSQQQRTYLNQLCEDVIFDVKGAVCKADSDKSDLEKHWARSPLHQEVLHHARLCRSRGAAYRGPQAYLNRVREYLMDDNYSMVPLVISGGADKNKSKLMGMVGQQVRQWIQPECVVLMRFLGTSPDSCDIRRVLVGIIYQICAVYEMAMPQLNELGSFDRVIGCFGALLASVAIKHGAERPLVLILDCLEKAASTEGNHTVAWLPQMCPPNVFLITSIASDSQHLLDVLHDRLVEDMCFLSLDTLLNNTEFQEDLLPDSSSDSEDEDSDSASNDSGSTERTREGAASEVGLVELVSRRLDTLEERHGEVVISWLFSYLAIGEGLTEMELLDVMSINHEVMEEVFIGSDVPRAARKRFPQKLWALIQRDIGRFMEERYVDSKVVLSLGDEQVQETVESRYLNESRLCECCVQLAELLQGSQDLYDDDEDEDLTEQHSVAPQPLLVTNRRKLRRLPVLFYRSQAFDSISDLLKSRMLCNFTWLLTKLKSLHFDQFIEDFHMVKEHDDEIEFVRDLMMLSKSVVETDANKLSAEIVARISVPACSGKPHLHHLLRDATAWCSNLSHGVYMVPKFPCFPCPSGYLRRTIQGPWHALGMCGDSLLVVWGKETGLEVWNATTSECLHHFCTPFTWEDSYLTSDGRYVYQTCDTKLLGWDVHTAKKVCDIDILPAVSDTGRRQNTLVDDSFMTPIVISDDRMLAAIRINKPEMLLKGKGLALVDLQRELVVHTAIDAMGDRVSNCKFTTDGNRIIVTETQIMPGQTSVVHVFDCLTMESMGTQILDERYTIVPDTLHLSRDDSMLIVGSRPDNFLVFSVHNCSPLLVPLEPADEELSRFVDMKVLLSDNVILLSVDVTSSAVLRMYDLMGNIQGPILTSNTGRPKFIEVSESQNLAFVGFLEVGALDIWDLHRSFLLYTLKAHSGHITSTLLSPTCRSLYTGGTDGAIRVWKFADMMAGKGRVLQTPHTPTPVPRSSYKPGVLKHTGGHQQDSEIPDDMDDILDLDGGESLVDDGVDITEDQRIDGTQGTVGEEQSRWSTESGGSQYETTINGEMDRDDITEGQHDDNDDGSYETDSDDEGETIMTGETSRLGLGSQMTSASTRYRSLSQQGSQPSRSAQCHGTASIGSAHSGRSKKMSASLRGNRQNTSAPGWARDGSFLNRTIREDEITSDSPSAIDVQQLVSGQLGTAHDGGGFAQRSGCSIRSQLSQQSQRSGHNSSRGDRDSSRTDRTSDTNAKLEEIFRKLEQQNFEETPRFDDLEEPITTTTMLGSHGEVLDSIPEETKGINAFWMTDDGRHLVTSHRMGPPVMWNVERGDIVHRMEMPWDTGATTELLLSPDGKRLFGLSRLGFEEAQSSGYENCVRVWDLETGVCDPMPEEPLFADAFALTPDKKRLLLLRKRDNGTRFVILDASTLERMMVGEVYCQLCSPYVYITSDIHYVVTCDPGQTVTVWDLRNEDEYGVSAHVTIPLATIPPAMTLIDKEGTLLVGTGYGNIFVLPLEKSADMVPGPENDPTLPRLIPDRHHGEVLCLELSRDQQILVTSSSDLTMKVIDRDVRKTRHILRGHTDIITCIQLSEDKDWLASGSHDKTAHLWSLTTGQMLNVFHAYENVFSINLSPDKRTLSCLVNQQGTRNLIMLSVIKGKEEL